MVTNTAGLYPLHALVRGCEPSSAGKAVGEVAEGTMEEDAHRALRTIEDLADLSRAQPVDEPQEDDLAPVLGECGHGRS